MGGLSSDARIQCGHRGWPCTSNDGPSASRPVVCLVNISLLQESKAIGVVEKAGHVLLPDVIKQDSGRPFLYKPGFSRGAERVVVDVQFIPVVDGVEIVEQKVFYFILPDDAVGSVGGILFIIVDIYIDCLPVSVAEAKSVKAGSIAGQYMGRQLDLEKQGRDGLRIFLRDEMRCKGIYNGVGEHR